MNCKMFIFFPVYRIIKALERRLVWLTNKFGGGRNKISGIGLLRRFSQIKITGTDNFVEIKSRLPKDVKIYMYGSRHHLYIDQSVTFKRGVLWFEDDGCTIAIGQGTTIENAHFSAVESNHKIIVGADCMISANIYITTSDSHSIIDLSSGVRTNMAGDIKIEPRVWIGRDVTINKGVTIFHDSVIAGNSLVTRDIKENCIAGGIPAKVLRSGISWDRHRIK